MDQIPQIAPIKLPQLEAVAEIHQRAFPESALTRLGREAVRRYYEWQLAGPHNHQFIGLFQGGTLKAFAVGGISKGALSGFVRQNKYFLARSVLLHPGILLTGYGRRALRAAYRVFRGGQRNTTGPPSQTSPSGFGVLAIAVDPASRRSGFGKALMQELERAALACGFATMHLTVHPSNTTAIQFYERLGWARFTKEQEWNGLMLKRLERQVAGKACSRHLD